MVGVLSPLALVRVELQPAVLGDLVLVEEAATAWAAPVYSGYG
jgi:hypothetical protein